MSESFPSPFAPSPKSIGAQRLKSILRWIAMVGLALSIVGLAIAKLLANNDDFVVWALLGAFACGIPGAIALAGLMLWDLPHMLRWRRAERDYRRRLAALPTAAKLLLWDMSASGAFRTYLPAAHEALPAVTNSGFLRIIEERNGAVVVAVPEADRDLHLYVAPVALALRGRALESAGRALWLEQFEAEKRFNTSGQRRLH